MTPAQLLSLTNVHLEINSTDENSSKNKKINRLDLQKPETADSFEKLSKIKLPKR